MKEKKYQRIVERHKPKEERAKFALISFIVGGLVGVLGEGLICFYVKVLSISRSDASTYMIVTLIFIASLLTALGMFDNLVKKAKCGLLIPITGFAHSMTSAAIDYKKEGLVTGIGANMFKLAGSVIIFGVVSAYLFGLLRFVIMGG